MLIEHVLRHGEHHFGGDIAGRDRVDGDAFRGALLRKRFHEADIARLRRRVIRLARLTFLAVDRRNYDDAAEAAIAHAVDDRARDVEQRVQIGADDGVPLIEFHLVEQRSLVMPALLMSTSIGPRSFSICAMAVPQTS